MNVVALAGGVGGAKLADGLASCLKPDELTVVVNTGDDFRHLGLHVSPDLDTVIYTLAGVANDETGWGRADESWAFMQALERLGGETWFRLGDRDLATHVERTRRLAAGEPLSSIAQDYCRRLGVGCRVLPMSDDAVRTRVHSTEGDLPFQEYFVRLRCQPVVTGFAFEGAEAAAPAPGVLEALRQADRVIVCPSNPWVSIDPILAVPGVRAALQVKPVCAVSPIVGGRAIKGPAAKMFDELGIKPSALAVAQHYAGWCTEFVLDSIDAEQVPAVEALGMRCLASETIMRTRADRGRLAREVLEIGR